MPSHYNIFKNSFRQVDSNFNSFLILYYPQIKARLILRGLLKLIKSSQYYERTRNENIFYTYNML